ncbi:MAG: hypothetical protein H7095_00185 [Pseudopedobacter sp.]|nr:hypothetical protein [Deinococcales bacterium]
MKTKEKEPDLPVSSRGFALRCPHCANPRLDLSFIRDGMQAYWCHRCERGFRIGEMPPAGIYRASDAKLEVHTLKTLPQTDARAS